MRVGDWERSLAAFIARCEGREHAYGQHDCLMFAGGAAEAITGIDPAASFRGSYSTHAGSLRALLRDGAEQGHDGTLEAAIAARYREIPIGFAGRGDWAWHDGAVGVVLGGFALFVGATIDGESAAEKPGLIRVPRALWQKAWRVE